MKIQKKQEIEFFGTKTGNANSIALGYATETKNFGEVAVGVMNKSTAAKDPNSSKGVCIDPDATLFSVGCGGNGERKNALEVKGDGSVIIPGENGNINIADKIKQAFDTDASIELVKSTENSLQYTLMVNNESRGSINIPKDQFLKNVTYDSEGKQLVFTFVTIDEDEHVERVPVGDLKDVYTAGEGINIDNNVISADFSSVMTAISDEKTLRETTDNEIKSTLDTKADKTELDGKFDKVDVVLELGNAENKVISQNIVSFYFNTINSKMFANNVISHSYSYPLEITEIEDDIRIDFNIGWNNYSSVFTSNEKFSTTGKEIFSTNPSTGMWVAVVFDILTREFKYITLQNLDKSDKSNLIYLFSCDTANGKITYVTASGFPITKYNDTLYISIGSRDNWIKLHDDDISAQKIHAQTIIPYDANSLQLSVNTTSNGFSIDFNIGWNNYSSVFTSNEKFSTTSEEVLSGYGFGWYAILFNYITKTFRCVELQRLNTSIKKSEIFILSCDKLSTGVGKLLTSGFLITKYDGVLYLSIGAKENWIAYDNLKNSSSGSYNKNTSIFQIGDSITWQKDNKKDDDPVTNQYVYKGNGFVRYICEKLGIPANRHFPRGQNGQTIIGYAEYLTNNPDAFPKSSVDLSNIIWIIELGTNDWGAATEIGSKSDYTNNNGNNSVYGALRTIVDYILPSIDSKQAPHVIMLTPMDRGAYSNNTESSWKPCSFSYNADGEITFTKNEKNYTINDYAEAIRWVCEREGFVCIDFLKNPICSRKYFNRAMTFSECVMQNDTNIPEVYQDIYGDNLHPTDKGDKMMGEFILKKAKHIFSSI